MSAAAHTASSATTAGARPAGRPAAAATERGPWRSVAMPTEHGGWGLTLEPVVLGLAVAWSAAGLAIGTAAFLAFLARTPLKLVLVDHHRDRMLPRTRRALTVLGAETVAMVALATLALVRSGAAWLVPVAVAAPLVVVELAFDARSRSRRLVPELCGAAGIAASAAAIALAGGESGRLAAALWLVLGTRAAAAIPAVRCQIARLRRGSGNTAGSDIAQALSLAAAAAAVALDRRALAGAIGLGVLALIHVVAVRRPVPPPKVIGLRQMALGLALVAVTATGALL